MVRILSAALGAAFLMLATASGALAQSGCNIFVYGKVPTPGQWNQCLASKQDLLNYVPLNVAGGVMTGRLSTVPSTTIRAGFAIPAGVAPTSPVDGDIWTTTAGVFAQINGSTVGPFASASAIPSVVQGDVLYGSAVGVISTLAKSTSATRYLANTGAANNPAWAQVNLTNGVTGALPFANMPSGTQDTVLGYYGGTAITASAVPNCATALTYNTSTHVWACNSSTGAGTVTSIGLTATAPLGISGSSSPITSSGTYNVSMSIGRVAAYLTTNPSASGFTQVIFDTAVTDSQSAYNTGSGVYIPSLSGSYLVTFKLRCAATTALTGCSAEIRKNGTGYARMSSVQMGGSSTTFDAIVTALIPVNGTSDTISFYGNASGTGTFTFTGGTAPQLTYFNANYVGP